MSKRMIKLNDDKIKESDDESNDEENDESNDEENDESNDEENDILENVKENKKEKIKKLNHEEILEELIKIIESENLLENEILDLEKNLVLKIKQRNTLRKLKNKNIILLPKAYIDGIGKAKKEKKKRTNNNKNGILAEHPVPPVLSKFLNLDENIKMMRPRVFSLLNNKFKELGLKNGQNTVLDKKTAKIFDKPEGYIIHFKECQKFLAEIYEKNNKLKEVVL